MTPLAVAGGRLSPEPIDAVYLWVDGADPSFRARLLGASTSLPGGPPAHESTDPSRFRDSGELRFSLRSLERFAPWVRRIYLVTDGQVPSWLALWSPKLRLVRHEAIFRNDASLPTFNSNAIELQLHRIPGLSRRFLYLNDDVFFGAAVTPDTFLPPDGTLRVFLQNTPLHDRRDTGPVHDRAYAHTQRVIDERWDRPGARLLPAHVPQLYDKEIVADLERALPEEFANTSAHRFRSADDLVLRVAYFYYLIEGRAGAPASATILEERSRDYCFARLGRSPVANVLQLMEIARFRPRFFCINDETDDSLHARLLLRALPLFLQAMFPHKSSFEAEP